MIKLELFRLLTEDYTIKNVEEADVDCRYTPYRIFVLETRLYPLIYKMFDYNIYISPKSVYNPKKNRMDVYLHIVKILKDTEETVELTPEQTQIIQDQIDQITSKDIDYALIDIKEFHKSLVKKYPLSWFRSVIEYIELDDEYNSFVKEEGIYLTFDPNSEYKKDYYNVCEFLKKRIEEYYSKGVIVLANIINSEKRDELVKDWDLLSIDKYEKIKRLFQPMWKDLRFAENQVDFLTRKIKGDSYIRVLLPSNLVKRYFIFKKLETPFIVEGSYIKVKADNISEAQNIATLITSQISKSEGRVVTLSTFRMSEIYLFMEYADKFKKGEYVSYSVSNNENPLMFSLLLKKDDYTSTDDLREKIRNYTNKRLVEVSKISKLKNMSPHEIIEREYEN